MKLNPAPLGLAAFALTTFLLSIHNLGFIEGSIVISLAIFYGGLAQFCAGMLSFKAENNFAGTAFSSYGAFWLAFGLAELLKGYGIVSFTAKETGLMLIAWGIFTFYMWIPSLKIGKAISLVFLTLWLTFFALGFASLLSSSHKIGGAIGIICSILAWYVSAGELINEFYGKKVIL
ncbi:MAG: acetate uptake transporter [Thermoplasmatales archaeon]|nr:acetate uptake transporter [Thermoplasmatales archaeon]